MESKHILNIGFPRCGSTWLWRNLTQHPSVDKPGYIKENKIMFDDTYLGYKDFYKNYNVSANFNPNLWTIDLELIKYLSNYATHVSIIFRNPYDFIQRYYDFIFRGKDTNDIVDRLISLKYVDYQTICSRWVDSINFNTKFKIFYFDDLVANSDLFLSNYFKFCQLDDILIKDSHIVKNATVHLDKTLINFSKEHKKTINQYIDNFSTYTNTDFSHWKQ
jgi:hypothetical protein